MWLFTENGFYSVVAFDPAKARFEFDGSRFDDYKDLVLVRGRDKDDMLTLKRGVEEAYEAYGVEVPLVETPNGDYLYRIVLSKGEWIDFLCATVDNIDYSNFKDAVTKQQGEKRHDLYMRVWGVMSSLQPTRWEFPAKKQGRSKKQKAKAV